MLITPPWKERLRRAETRELEELKESVALQSKQCIENMIEACEVVRKRSEARTVQRVVVCDDDPDMRHLVSSILRNRGLEVLEVGTGKECIQVLTAMDVDTIIVDLGLPGINGFDILDLIKSSPIRKVVITGLSKPERQGIEKKYDITLVEKPFESQVLVDAVFGRDDG